MGQDFRLCYDVVRVIKSNYSSFVAARHDDTGHRQACVHAELDVMFHNSPYEHECPNEYHAMQCLIPCPIVP